MNEYLLRSRLKLFLTLLFPLFAVSKDFNKKESHIDVSYDHTFYSIHYSPKKFLYKNGSVEFSIAIRDCNKKVVNKIMEQFDFFLKDYLKQKQQEITKYDVNLSMEGGSMLHVSRGSELGTWLRTFPKRMMYHHAEALVVCK